METPFKILRGSFGRIFYVLGLVAFVALLFTAIGCGASTDENQQAVVPTPTPTQVVVDDNNDVVDQTPPVNLLNMHLFAKAQASSEWQDDTKAMLVRDNKVGDWRGQAWVTQNAGQQSITLTFPFQTVVSKIRLFDLAPTCANLLSARIIAANSRDASRTFAPIDVTGLPKDGKTPKEISVDNLVVTSLTLRILGFEDKQYDSANKTCGASNTLQLGGLSEFVVWGVPKPEDEITDDTNLTPFTFVTTPGEVAGQLINGTRFNTGPNRAENAADAPDLAVGADGDTKMAWRSKNAGGNAEIKFAFARKARISKICLYELTAVDDTQFSEIQVRYSDNTTETITKNFAETKVCKDIASKETDFVVFTFVPGKVQNRQAGTTTLNSGFSEVQLFGKLPKPV